MGTWGEALFSDDTAVDVRDVYREELRRSGSPEVAVNAVLSQFARELADPDDGPVVWLALAVTEHKLGYATASVFSAAKRVLDDRLGLERWKEQGPAALRARLKEYDRIRALLDSPRPMPKPIKIKKVRFDDSGLRPGDLVRIPIGAPGAAEEAFAYLKVLRIEHERDAALPIAVVLDHPPSAAAPPNPQECPTLAVRNLGGVDYNVRLRAVKLRRWRGRGSPWKSVQVVGAAHVTAEEEALSHEFPYGCEWAKLPELIRLSLDRTEWPTSDSLERRFRKMTPTQIRAAADEILQEIAKPHRDIILIGAPARRLAESGDYERSLAAVEIALRASPDSWEFHALRGCCLHGLQRSSEAEQAWTLALSLATATGNKFVIDRAHANVREYRSFPVRRAEQ